MTNRWRGEKRWRTKNSYQATHMQIPDRGCRQENSKVRQGQGIFFEGGLCWEEGEWVDCRIFALGVDWKESRQLRKKFFRPIKDYWPGAKSATPTDHAPFWQGGSIQVLHNKVWNRNSKQLHRSQNTLPNLEKAIIKFNREWYNISLILFPLYFKKMVFYLFITRPFVPKKINIPK